MSQAIQTKSYGPTDTKGTRVIARTGGARIILSWDYSQNEEENHRRAALALAAKLEWGSEWIGGYLEGLASYVWVRAVVYFGEYTLTLSSVRKNGTACDSQESRQVRAHFANEEKQNEHV